MNQPCYRIRNNKTADSSFSDLITAGYSENKDIDFIVPKTFGRGYWKRIICDEGIDLNLMDITLNKEVSMESFAPSGTYDFAFCQGIPEHWLAEQIGEKYALKSGQCYMHRNNGIRNICILQPDFRHHNIRIRLREEKLRNVVRCFERQICVKFIFEDNIVYLTHAISPRIKVILQEIANCPYHGKIAKVYLNAKVHELLVVYLYEKLSATGYFASSNLTYREHQRLQQAKRLIDENIAQPLTISEISRIVFLNENKLKNGFKEIFGYTVYSYIKDRRLEEARALLEEKRTNVTEAAYHVGYTNLSHFAESFREKFGINPGEYLNSR